MKAATGWTLALATGSAMLVSTLHAQRFAYPAKGQSAEQQKKDEAESADGRRGRPATIQQSLLRRLRAPARDHGDWHDARGRRARRCTRRCRRRRVGGDAGAGAAAGAAAARAQSRRQNQVQQQQAAASQQQAQSSANTAWAKARGACPEGKGYTVK